MRDNHPIDDFFREGISDAEFSPSNKVWNSIDKKLEAKNNPGKSGNLTAKLAAGMAGLGVIATLVYTLNSTDSSSSKNTVTSKEITAPVTTVPQTAISTNNSVSKTETQPASSTISSPNNTSVNQVTSARVINTNPSANTNALNENKGEQEEVVIKPKTIYTLTTEDKKDNSDKTILMLPYYASTNNSKDNAAQNEKSTNANLPSKGEIAEPVSKTENSSKENIIFVPNAFTPNGDGLNDVFIPQTVDNVKEYKMYIYDRNGATVFFTDEVHKGWDGHIQNNGAESVREDVYMWRIEFKNSKGEKEHLMGYLNLLK